MAVDMFLKIDGVKGESKDQAHTQEIDVFSWSWGMSNSGSAHRGGEDRLTESVSLNFAKVKVEYLPQEAKGGKGNMIPFSWDIAANDDEV
jgi:type VI protein secretion system component Hcp